jgi:SAM-dependent methyltransferase
MPAGSKREVSRFAFPVSRYKRALDCGYLCGQLSIAFCLPNIYAELSRRVDKHGVNQEEYELTEYFDKAAVVWDEDPDRVEMAKAIALAMIRELMPEGNEITLDYGTGTGLISLELREHVKKIVAVDSSPGMLEVLRGKIAQERISSIEPKEWQIGRPADGLPSFDIIVSSMTFHHMPDTEAAARALYSLLKPGGRIAVADLDSDNGEFHEKPGIAEHDGFDRHHLHEIFAAAGFRDIRFTDACRISRRSSHTEQLREFTIFLLTAAR